METPSQRVAAQGDWCRRQWRSQGEAERGDLRARLDRSDADWLDRAWVEVLDGRHPFVAWLDSELPWEEVPAWEGLPEARQLVSSNPFRLSRPWSSPLTSPASSSTLPDSSAGAKL